eukprot:CAMPEP_0184547684 /NCGR_PEP_ID=MMETSP0199_2-20130426/5735_1 /TAXON_ID=1112570 /ORGANISM="Thraustochytrium sp., Strain LLF1b" /LENGTH=494 /DNA_ID=CAMNT_0026942213 /DNA_START=58 /DNA_END=1542 /DNA_ORIENTATION=+
MADEEEDNLAGQLDSYAQEMLASLRASDRAINSAATRIRYDPGQQIDGLGVASPRSKETLPSRSCQFSLDAANVNDDDKASTDSFLQALEAEDDQAMLAKWRRDNKRAVATFKDLLSGDESNDGADTTVRTIGSRLSSSSRGTMRSSASKKSKSSKLSRGRSVASERSRRSRRSKSKGLGFKTKSETPRSRSTRRSLSKPKLKKSNRSLNVSVRTKPRSGNSSVKQAARPKVRKAGVGSSSMLSSKVKELQAANRKLRSQNEALQTKLSRATQKAHQASERERAAALQGSELEGRLRKQRQELVKLRQEVQRLKAGAQNSRVRRGSGTKAVPGKLRKTLEQPSSNASRTGQGTSKASVRRSKGETATFHRKTNAQASRLATTRALKLDEVPSLSEPEQTQHQLPVTNNYLGPSHYILSSPSSLQSTTRTPKTKTFASAYSSSSEESENSVERSRSSRKTQSVLNISYASEPHRNQTAFERYQKLKNLYTSKYSP